MQKFTQADQDYFLAEVRKIVSTARNLKAPPKARLEARQRLQEIVLRLGAFIASLGRMPVRTPEETQVLSDNIALFQRVLDECETALTTPPISRQRIGIAGPRLV